MSSETIQLGNFGLKMVDDEEIDVNDLEVAMINESFEEKLKQSQFFHSSQSTDLKSLFYGDGILNETTGKRDSTEFTEEEVKIKLTPLKFLPRITPNSELEDDAERGRQLDIELDRMMLEEEDKYFFSNSPPSLLSPDDDKPEQISRYKFSSASTFVLDQNSSSFYSSFESQTDQDSIDCADAAEAVAYDVIQSLFADDENSGEPVASDDEDEDMVLSASILQVLQDDETDSFEDDDSKEGMPSIKKQKLADDEDSTNEELPPPPPRNDSLQTIPSPMATEDEQQVPVVESWEELFKEPSAAEKMHNEARAILKKIRAERKASQL